MNVSRYVTRNHEVHALRMELGVPLPCEVHPLRDKMPPAVCEALAKNTKPGAPVGWVDGPGGTVTLVCLGEMIVMLRDEDTTKSSTKVMTVEEFNLVYCEIEEYTARAEFVSAVKWVLAEVHLTARQKGQWPPGGDYHAQLTKQLKAGLTGVLDSVTSPERESSAMPGYSRAEEQFAAMMVKLLDCAAFLGIRVGEAVTTKVAIDKEQTTKHGGKRFQ